MAERVILAADIGGTHTNLGITSLDGPRPDILFSKIVPTSSAKSFTDLLNVFVGEAITKGYHPQGACFAVAGPVESHKGGQRARMTNTKLVMDSAEIARKTPLKEVMIINDFDAIGYATNVLSKSDFVTLNKGRSVDKATRAVIGAGTGLGKSILHHQKEMYYIPLASEGGHADLPILSQEELNLADFIKSERRIHTQVRYEDVLSGRGLEILYRFLSSTKFHGSGSLSAKEISATRKSNPCSRATFELFVRFYARCARNFCLDTLCEGGLYLAGGICAKNPDAFSGFIKEFEKNEVHERILKDITVCMITNYQISLVGAAFAFKIRSYEESS